MKYLYICAILIFVPFSAKAQNYPDCKEKIRTVASKGIIKNIKVSEARRRVEIYMNPQVYMPTSYNTKINISKNIQCMFLKGDTDEVLLHYIINSKTGNVMAYWNGVELNVK